MKTTLIGAGLVGSLLSLFLREKGQDVEIFEKRRDLRTRDVSRIVGEGRSINLAISVRGFHALEALGLKSEVEKFCIPMRGRMIHALGGELSFQKYGTRDQDAIHSLSRSWLNGFLMDQAERRGVRIHFQKELSSVSFEECRLDFKDGSHYVFGCVIGTDGSASVLRAELERTAGVRVRSEELTHSYKEFVMDAPRAGQFAMEPGALHIWPRGKYMMIALPNFDGSFTCTLFMPTEGPVSFASLTTSADIEALFVRDFRDFSELVPDYCSQFKNHPTGKMVTIKTDRWTHSARPREVLLIGDAAHAIVPFFGQGMNCGFEDCELLMHQWDAASVHGFQAFSDARRIHTDAIADMAVENLVEMADKTADPEFLFKKQIERVLQERFPETYVSKYSLVSFSRTPYAEAKRVGERQEQILDTLSKEISSISELDLERARALMDRHLGDIRTKGTPWI